MEPVSGRHTRVLGKADLITLIIVVALVIAISALLVIILF